MLNDGRGDVEKQTVSFPLGNRPIAAHHCQGDAERARVYWFRDQNIWLFPMVWPNTVLNRTRGKAMKNNNPPQTVKTPILYLGVNI